MSNSSPPVLRDVNGNPIVVDDAGTPGGSAGAMVSGYDGSAARRLLTDTGGRQIQILHDGTNGPVAVKAASVAPVATDKALVVTISPNCTVQTSAVSANATKSEARGIVVLGNSTSGTLQPVRATAYTEQSSNATRSLSSSSASDTGAGVGAQQVKITYYDSTGAGPNTETVTLNGTTAVATSNNNICFIESLEVVRVGSTGWNVGTITLFVNNSGGGGTIGTIGTNNIVSGQGDNKTWWAHHYVPTGKTASLYVYVVGISPNLNVGQNHLRAKSIGVTGAVDVPVSEVLITTGPSISRQLTNPILVTGPARVTAYVVPSANGLTCTAAFDISEQ